MTSLPVSVIVVSRGRPAELMRCLAGLEQLDYPSFEIVVVADPDGLNAVRQSRFGGRLKAIKFDRPNISAARNIGLAIAAGEVVAFIDDDAVPEPTWLTHLTCPFADKEVAAAGGHVRGRNGISFQNRARRVNALGEHQALELDGGEPQVFPGTPGDAIKTEGTNCAFRRNVITNLGGFDPAFAFYMDETDLNLRLAAAGHSTAVVPLAQVHHGFAASAHRHQNRMPRSLFDVGASQMVLLRKHAPEADHPAVLTRLRAEQRARLMRHMVAGTCEPRDVGRVLATLEDGIAEGAMRPFGEMAEMSDPSEGFLDYKAQRPFAGMTCLAGRIWQAGRLRREARRHLAEGRRVSLFLFSPTVRFHRVVFTGDGIWEQRGGLWGRSDRDQPIVRAVGFARRLRQEITRVGKVRKLEI